MRGGFVAEFFCMLLIANSTHIFYNPWLQKYVEKLEDNQFFFQYEQMGR